MDRYRSGHPPFSGDAARTNYDDRQHPRAQMVPGYTSAPGYQPYTDREPETHQESWDSQGYYGATRRPHIEPAVRGPYSGSDQASMTYPGSAQVTGTYPGNIQATGTYPGSDQAPGTYPGSGKVPVTFPGSVQASGIYPGSAQAPGSAQVSNTYPGSGKVPGTYPGSVQASRTYPGSVKALGSVQASNTYPGSAKAPETYPGSVKAPGTYPRSSQVSKTYPGSVQSLGTHQEHDKAPNTYQGSAQGSKDYPESLQAKWMNRDYQGPWEECRSNQHSSRNYGSNAYTGYHHAGPSSEPFPVTHRYSDNEHYREKRGGEDRYRVDPEDRYRSDPSLSNYYSNVPDTWSRTEADTGSRYPAAWSAAQMHKEKSTSLAMPLSGSNISRTDDAVFRGSNPSYGTSWSNPMTTHTTAPTAVRSTSDLASGQSMTTSSIVQPTDQHTRDDDDMSICSDQDDNATQLPSEPCLVFDYGHGQSTMTAPKESPSSNIVSQAYDVPSSGYNRRMDLQNSFTSQTTSAFQSDTTSQKFPKVPSSEGQYVGRKFVDGGWSEHRMEPEHNFPSEKVKDKRSKMMWVDPNRNSPSGEDGMSSGSCAAGDITGRTERKSLFELKVPETKERKEMFHTIAAVRDSTKASARNNRQANKSKAPPTKKPTTAAASADPGKYDLTEDIDDEPHVQSQLFIGALGNSATETDVRKLLKHRNADVWIGHNPSTRQRCGFVKLSTLREAKQMLKELSGRGNVRLTAAQDFENFTIGKPQEKRGDSRSESPTRTSFFNGYVEMECPGAPLLGLKYIKEYVDDGTVPSIFVCSLCVSQLEGPEVARHIIGFNHRCRYFRSHHPSIYEELYRLQKKVDFLSLTIKCANYATRCIQPDHAIDVIFTDTPHSLADRQLEELQKKAGVKKPVGSESPVMQLSLEELKNTNLLTKSTVQASSKQSHTVSTSNTRTASNNGPQLRAVQSKCVVYIPSLPESLQDVLQLKEVAKGGHMVPYEEGKDWVHLHKRMTEDEDGAVENYYIGLKYMLELQIRNETSAPSNSPTMVVFKCQLCDVINDDVIRAMTHAKTFMHKIKYMSNHYPVQYERVMSHVSLPSQKKEMRSQAAFLCNTEKEKDQSVRVAILKASKPGVDHKQYTQSLKQQVLIKEKELLAQLKEMQQKLKQHTEAKQGKQQHQGSQVQSLGTPSPSPDNTEPQLEDLLMDAESAVGLRYVTEILDDNKSIPAVYECKLCHMVKADANKIYMHITGTVHRIKFLESNFPVLSRQCNGRPELLTVLSREIEEKHGRDTYAVKKLLAVDLNTGKPVYKLVTPAKAANVEESDEQQQKEDTSSNQSETRKLCCFEDIIAGLDYTPLLGLKHITEYLQAGETWAFNSPTCRCSLCTDIPGLNTDNILKHICSMTHRTNFIQHNYPSLYEELQMTVRDPSRYLSQLNHFSKEIELMEGRGAINKVVTVKSENSEEEGIVDDKMLKVKQESEYQDNDHNQQDMTACSSVDTPQTSVEPPSSVQVYIGNWPQESTVEELQELLKSLPHKGCQLKVSQGNQIKYGSVECETYTDARELMRKLNKVVFKGRSLRLRFDQTLHKQQKATASAAGKTSVNESFATVAMVTDKVPESKDRDSSSERMADGTSDETTNVRKVSSLAELQNKEAEALRETEWKNEIALLEEKTKAGELVTCTTLRPSKLMKVHSAFMKRFPIIGLMWVTEIQKSDEDREPWYLCYLCRHCLLATDITSHLISIHHRFNYLKKKYKVKFDKLQSLLNAGCCVEELEKQATFFARQVFRIERMPAKINVKVEVMATNIKTEATDSATEEAAVESAGSAIPSPSVSSKQAQHDMTGPMIPLTDIVTDLKAGTREVTVDEEMMKKKLEKKEITKTGRRSKFSGFFSKLLSAKDCVIIGLTWLTEIQDDERPDSPMYQCRLCQVKQDRHNIITHLVSLGHRLLYMRKCHPNVYEELESGWRSRVRLAEKLELWAMEVTQNESLKADNIEVLVERAGSLKRKADDKMVSERGAKRGPDRRTERGSDRNRERGTERGTHRGSSREGDTGSSRSAERDTNKGSDRSSNELSNKDSRKGTERDSSKRSHRSSIRGSERGSNKGSESSSSRLGLNKDRHSSKGTDRKLAKGRDNSQDRRKTFSSQDEVKDNSHSSEKYRRDHRGKHSAQRDGRETRPDQRSATVTFQQIQDEELDEVDDILTENDIYALEMQLYEQQDALDAVLAETEVTHVREASFTDVAVVAPVETASLKAPQSTPTLAVSKQAVVSSAPIATSSTTVGISTPVATRAEKSSIVSTSTAVATSTKATTSTAVSKQAVVSSAPIATSSTTVTISTPVAIRAEKSSIVSTSTAVATSTKATTSTAVSKSTVVTSTVAVSTQLTSSTARAVSTSVASTTVSALRAPTKEVAPTSSAPAATSTAVKTPATASKTGASAKSMAIKSNSTASKSESAAVAFKATVSQLESPSKNSTTSKAATSKAAAAKAAAKSKPLEAAESFTTISKDNRDKSKKSSSQKDRNDKQEDNLSQRMMSCHVVLVPLDESKYRSAFTIARSSTDQKATVGSEAGRSVSVASGDEKTKKKSQSKKRPASSSLGEVSVTMEVETATPQKKHKLDSTDKSSHSVDSMPIKLATETIDEDQGKSKSVSEIGDTTVGSAEIPSAKQHTSQILTDKTVEKEKGADKNAPCDGNHGDDDLDGVCVTMEIETDSEDMCSERKTHKERVEDPTEVSMIMEVETVTPQKSHQEDSDYSSRKIAESVPAKLTSEKISEIGNKSVSIDEKRDTTAVSGKIASTKEQNPQKLTDKTVEREKGSGRKKPSDGNLGDGNHDGVCVTIEIETESEIVPSKEKTHNKKVEDQTEEARQTLEVKTVTPQKKLKEDSDSSSSKIAETVPGNMTSKNISKGQIKSVVSDTTTVSVKKAPAKTHTSHKLADHKTVDTEKGSDRKAAGDSNHGDDNLDGVCVTMEIETDSQDVHSRRKTHNEKVEDQTEEARQTLDVKTVTPQKKLKVRGGSSSRIAESVPGNMTSKIGEGESKSVLVDKKMDATAVSVKIPSTKEQNSQKLADKRLDRETGAGRKTLDDGNHDSGCISNNNHGDGNIDGVSVTVEVETDSEDVSSERQTRRGRVIEPTEEVSLTMEVEMSGDEEELDFSSFIVLDELSDED